MSHGIATNATLLIMLFTLLETAWILKGSLLISQDKKDIIRNLYLSGIGEEFIAMQLDLEIPVVINILKEFNIYTSGKKQNPS